MNIWTTISQMQHRESAMNQYQSLISKELKVWKVNERIKMLKDFQEECRQNYAIATGRLNEMGQFAMKKMLDVLEKE